MYSNNDLKLSTRVVHVYIKMHYVCTVITHSALHVICVGTSDSVHTLAATTATNVNVTGIGN